MRSYYNKSQRVIQSDYSILNKSYEVKENIVKDGDSNINEVLLIVIVVLLIHSLIGTILVISTKEDESVAIYYAIGVIGWIVSLFCLIVKRIIHWNKYHDKRSIFKNEETGKQYWCKTKDSNDVEWVEGYKIVKRYALKSEWSVLEPFSKEFIEKSKCNCDNCKYDDDCTFDMYRASLDRIKCKHDVFGVVTEFDKFEKK